MARVTSEGAGGLSCSVSCRAESPVCKPGMWVLVIGEFSKWWVLLREGRTLSAFCEHLNSPVDEAEPSFLGANSRLVGSLGLILVFTPYRSPENSLTGGWSTDARPEGREETSPARP